MVLCRTRSAHSESAQRDEQNWKTAAILLDTKGPEIRTMKLEVVTTFL